MTLTIRDLVASDKPSWMRLWAAYLEFYKQTLPSAVTEHTWARLLDPAGSHAARVAEDATGLLGFATHLHHPSTWGIAHDCYLEDLFVADTARGKGVGRALILDLQTLATARGWRRLYWHTHRDNARARALYDSLVPADDFVKYTIGLQQ